jgi:hypothetical protein
MLRLTYAGHTPPASKDNEIRQPGLRVGCRDAWDAWTAASAA